MNFFSRLFKKAKEPVQLTCPRCLGKGHVDRDDIIRLKQVGKWGPGACAYCNGAGKVDEEILSKVAADVTYLTSNLSEAERTAIINNTKREGCPVSEYNRLWLEYAFIVLLDFFGKENTRQRKVLVPHYADFPIQYNGSEQSAYETLKIVAAQMEVSFDSVVLGFYDDRVQEVSTGNPFGRGIYLVPGPGDLNAAGLYYGRAENGKYEIWLNRKNLQAPEYLVATMAHEIAHIKLLGENRIAVNNEPLTDLATVMFGLGVFNANAAFQTYTNIDSRGWRAQGYLSQIQWGYALALFSYVREETSPVWIDQLTPNVKSDFLQAQRFIEANRELVFQDTPLPKNLP